MHSSPTTRSVLGNNTDRRRQKVELNLLFFGIPDFHFIGRHLVAGSAVDQVHILLMDPERTSHTVNGNIPAADHDNPAALRVRIPSFVDIQEVFDTRDKPFVPFFFPLDPHGRAVLCPDSDKYRIEIVFQLLKGDVLSHGGVVVNGNTHFLNLLDL